VHLRRKVDVVEKEYSIQVGVGEENIFILCCAYDGITFTYLGNGIFKIKANKRQLDRMMEFGDFKEEEDEGR
jgi:hypothetical protein